MAKAQLPFIDCSRLRDPRQRASEVRKLRDACAEVGFFYAVGHGISEEVTNAALQTVRNFFELPLKEKLRIDTLNSPHTRGFMRSGGEYTAGKVDLREQLDIGPEANPVNWRERGLPPFYLLQGPNQWPERPAEFREHILEFWAEVKQVGRLLMGAFAEALGQPQDYWEKMGYFSDRNTACRMKAAHYPACAPGKEGQGLGAHKDYGFLAMLLQDDVGGLQVSMKDGSWLDATPIPGAFVCNIGELMELASGGAFQATTHRVVAKPRSRVSVPFFYNPSYHAVVKQVDTLPQDILQIALAQGNSTKKGAAVDLWKTRVGRPFGINNLSGYVRSQPEIFRRHAPDVLQAFAPSKM